MNEFARMLEVQIPGLRRYAGAPTRDVIRADDLVQSCLTRAVARQHLWQYGTDLRAWLFTIMHNQFASQLRRAPPRAMVDIDEAAHELRQYRGIVKTAVEAANQDGATVMRATAINFMLVRPDSGA